MKGCRSWNVVDVIMKKLKKPLDYITDSIKKLLRDSSFIQVHFFYKKHFENIKMFSFKIVKIGDIVNKSNNSNHN